MAIQPVVNVSLYCVGDGSSTTFTFDLLNTPLIPNVEAPNGGYLRAADWLPFTPAGIVSNAAYFTSTNVAGTATISGTVVTVTWPTGHTLGAGATDEVGFAIYF